MSVAATIAGGSLLPHAAGGGLLLLLTWGLARGVDDPPRRQRLGLWGMAAALLAVALSFGPAWLSVPLPARAPEPAVAEPTPPEADDGLVPVAAAEEVDAVADAPPEPLAAPVTTTPMNLTAWLGAAHAAGALALLLRLLLGHVALGRLLRDARPAPEEIVQVCAALAPGRGVPRLLRSRRLCVPVSCGLLRPTIVLPVALCGRPDAPELRWALAHELTHLERRDPWAALLFGLGAAVFFPLPWFWALRRQVRLSQEHVADAAAARQGPAEDYAAFLLSLTGTPAVPAGALGVLGHTSDLFRRIAMLLHDETPSAQRPPRLWSLGAAGALLALAVIVAGVGLRADAAPALPEDVVARGDDTPKEDAKKDRAKKEDAGKNRRDAASADLEKLLQSLERMPALDEEKMKEVRQRLEEALKRFPQVGQEWKFDAKDFGNVEGLRALAGAAAQPQQGRLGVHAEKPSDALADQLDLPKGQGLVVVQVVAGSAAAKAGLKPNDVLLELAGKTVPNEPAGLAKIVAALKTKEPVEAVVLRKGKKETLKGLALPEVKTARAGGGSAVGRQGLNPLGGGGGLGSGGGFGGGGFAGGQGGGGGFGGGGPGVFGNAGGVMTTLFRTDNRFTGRHQEGTLVISVTGTVDDGKAKVSEISVNDGGTKHKYESAGKVPAEYRDKVKNLVEMSEKGSVKVEIRKQ